MSGVGGARPRYFILNRFVMSHVVRSVGSAGQTARLPLPRAVSVPANRREHLPPTVVARIIPASARKLFKYSLVHRKMMEGFAVRMAIIRGGTRSPEKAKEYAHIYLGGDGEACSHRPVLCCGHLPCL